MNKYLMELKQMNTVVDNMIMWMLRSLMGRGKLLEGEEVLGNRELAPC